MSVDSGAEAAKKPSGTAYSYYVLLLLTLVYTFNFVDRQIIGIISPLIKADMGLDDSQLGLLKGFAFALFYTVLGIPIARLADRMNRITIVSISLALWSGFTALSGVAQNFTQLALARIGVGVGEAGGTPPSHSVLSDYFPKEQRATALAIYALGIPVGISLGYFGFAALLSALQSGGVEDPGIWRKAMFLVGIPGVVVAVIVKLTIREPRRGAADGAAVVAETQRLSFAGEIAEVWRAARHLLAIPTYAGMTAGITLASFAAYAVGTWIVDFFTRSHPDVPMTTVLIWLGCINAFAYSAGTFLGGFVTERLAKTNKAMYGIVPAVALILNTPCFLLAMWVGDPTLSMIFWAGTHMAIGFYLGPTFSLAQTLAPVRLRSLSTAVLFFILNLIALGLGPSYVGIASDMLSATYGEALGLRIALSSVVVASLLAVVAYLWTSRKVQADWDRVTGASQ